MTLKLFFPGFNSLARSANNFRVSIKNERNPAAMKRYELSFPSINSERYVKTITALVMEPDKIDEDTGVMLFSHGWSGNRYQNLDKMEFTVDTYNLVCVSVEYRQSGFDFDPVTGLGSYRPYDYSFMQVFDVLNGLRQILELRPGLNRRRIFHYGGSQGGHVALLSALYAPATFSFVYAASPLVRVARPFDERAGRTFSEYEKLVRDTVHHAGCFRCFLCLEHGTEDQTVYHEDHTVKLEARLEELGKDCRVEYISGGGHNLSPTTTRYESFVKKAPEYLERCAGEGADDFSGGTVVELDCGCRTFTIDWSKRGDSTDLISWY